MGIVCYTATDNKFSHFVNKLLNLPPKTRFHNCNIAMALNSIKGRKYNNETLSLEALYLMFKKRKKRTK